jgi:hypothetical protein
MDHPRAGLKYVAAKDLDHSTIDFDDLDVIGSDGEKLGEVDGFVIDVKVVRPYYVVVNAGGWFTSKYFLLAIGQLACNTKGRTLVADVTRDRIARYPGFDRAEFDEISDDELVRLDRAMISICSPAEPAATSAMYRTPDWWDPAASPREHPSLSSTGGGDPVA